MDFLILISRRTTFSFNNSNLLFFCGFTRKDGVLIAGVRMPPLQDKVYKWEAFASNSLGHQLFYICHHQKVAVLFNTPPPSQAFHLLHITHPYLLYLYLTQ